jgi:glutamine---fructose-6-phosphate transaminase (isomerizing)
VSVTTAGALLRAEVAEQPETWLRLFTEGRDGLTAAADLLRAADPQLLVFAARGTSDHAAMYAQYLAHVRLGIPAMLATPSAFTAYGASLRYPRSVMIAVSQSGESPDLIATVQAARSAGVPVIAVTNSAASTVAGLGDVHVDLCAGPELSVAATKTYTAELLALHSIVSLAAGDSWDSLIRRRDRVVAAGAQLLGRDSAVPLPLVDLVSATDRLLVVGRGYSMASAREGALKLTETNGVAASGWSSADATHGPLGQVTSGTVVFVLDGAASTRSSVDDFGARASALGGTVIHVGIAVGPLDVALPLADIDDTLVPVLEILPFQTLALEAALRRGLDPDTPEGLAKVTRTH